MPPETEAMAWYIPLLIFFARICDVSIGTVRTMLVIAGHRFISAALGFFEVLIWVLAVGGALAYLTNPLALMGYAGGFATGVLIGMSIEERLALGYRMVRVISTRSDLDVSAAMREHGFRVTRVDGRGRSGPVEIAFLVVRRKRMHEVMRVLTAVNPEAFITIERVDRPSGGDFISDSRWGRPIVQRFFPTRK